jgi:hypothetical protein
MISYRAQLAKIGEQQGTPVSYQSFGWRPQSLRKAMRAMDFPKKFEQATEGRGQLDESWTEEIQGVVWAGAQWIFSSNGSQPEKGITVGDSPKALYIFDGKTKFKDPNRTVFFAFVHPLATLIDTVQPVIPPPPNEKTLNHIGAMVIHKGLLYVDHWIGNTGHLIVCEISGGIAFMKWIVLESAGNQRVNLVGINPWDDTIFTCHGETMTDRLFMHDLNGTLLRHKDGTVKELILTPPIDDGGYVQGGAFSPNGHIYIPSGKTKLGRQHQFIYCYSALNGHRLNEISVLAEEPLQELEGICYANLIREGHAVQLHAVLLDNQIAKDNIYLKSFAASEPDLV